MDTMSHATTMTTTNTNTNHDPTSHPNDVINDANEEEKETKFPSSLLLVSTSSQRLYNNNNTDPIPYHNSYHGNGSVTAIVQQQLPPLPISSLVQGGGITTTTAVAATGVAAVPSSSSSSSSLPLPHNSNHPPPPLQAANHHHNDEWSSSPPLSSYPNFVPDPDAILIGSQLLESILSVPTTTITTTTITSTQTNDATETNTDPSGVVDDDPKEAAVTVNDLVVVPPPSRETAVAGTMRNTSSHNNNNNNNNTGSGATAAGGSSSSSSSIRSSTATNFNPPQQHLSDHSETQQQQQQSSSSSSLSYHRMKRHLASRLIGTSATTTATTTAAAAAAATTTATTANTSAAPLTTNNGRLLVPVPPPPTTAATSTVVATLPNDNRSNSLLFNYDAIMALADTSYCYNNNNNSDHRRSSTSMERTVSATPPSNGRNTTTSKNGTTILDTDNHHPATTTKGMNQQQLLFSAWSSFGAGDGGANRAGSSGVEERYHHHHPTTTTTTNDSFLYSQPPSPPPPLQQLQHPRSTTPVQLYAGQQSAIGQPRRSLPRTNAIGLNVMEPNTTITNNGINSINSSNVIQSHRIDTTTMLPNTNIGNNSINDNTKTSIETSNDRRGLPELERGIQHLWSHQNTDSNNDGNAANVASNSTFRPSQQQYAASTDDYNSTGKTNLSIATTTSSGGSVADAEMYSNTGGNFHGIIPMMNHGNNIQQQQQQQPPQQYPPVISNFYNHNNNKNNPNTLLLHQPASPSNFMTNSPNVNIGGGGGNFSSGGPPSGNSSISDPVTTYSSSDLTPHQAENDLQPFCWDSSISSKYGVSRTLVLLHVSQHYIRINDVRAACETFGVLESFRADFVNKFGIYFISYYDIRSAQYASVELQSILQRISVMSRSNEEVIVQFCLSLNSSSQIDESHIILYNLPTTHMNDTTLLMSMLSSYGAVRTMQFLNDGTNSCLVEFQNLQDTKQALLELDNSQPFIGNGGLLSSNNVITIQVKERDENERRRGRDLLALLSRWRHSNNNSNGFAMQQQQQQQQSSYRGIPQNSSTSSSSIGPHQHHPLPYNMVTMNGGNSTPTSSILEQYNYNSSRSSSVGTGIGTTEGEYMSNNKDSHRKQQSPVGTTTSDPWFRDTSTKSGIHSSENVIQQHQHSVPPYVLGPEGRFTQSSHIPRSVNNGNSIAGSVHPYDFAPPMNNNNNVMDRQQQHHQAEQQMWDGGQQSYNQQQSSSINYQSMNNRNNSRTSPHQPGFQQHHQNSSYGNRNQHHDSRSVNNIGLGGTIGNHQQYHQTPYYSHTVTPSDSNSLPGRSLRSGSSHMTPGGQSHGTSAGNSSNMDNNLMMDLDLVEIGQDFRTSLMVRNIPNKYTQQMLLSEFDANGHGPGIIDFFYLPIDFKNRCNRGYAFINFVNYKDILSFHRRYFGKHWRTFNSDKICDITYARIQGKDAMLKRFENSALMEKDDEYKPLVFASDGPKRGARLPFPDPMNAQPLNHHQQQQQRGSNNNSHQFH